MKKTVLAQSLIIALCSLGLTAHAADTRIEQSKNKMTQEQTVHSDKAVTAHEQAQKSMLDKINKDVLAGYQSVIKAMRLLQKNKDKDALEQLQAATGKFDVALAANPDLGLVSIDSDVSVHALITTPDLVREDTKTAIKLLKDQQVQMARTLLEPMRDEMVISQVYLPMATYPDAIKLASKYLVDKKKDKALETLDTALSTLVIKKTIIPLALIRAESLIQDAADLNKETKKDKAKQLLDAAAEQLEIATVLGYTQKDSKAYDDLKSQIKAIRKEIDGKNAVEKMYDKIKSSFTDLIKKESTVK